MDAPNFIPDNEMPADAPSAHPQPSGDSGQLANAPDFIPDHKMEAGEGSKTPDFIPDSDFVADEDKYGTTGQQAKAGLEGLSKGVLGSTLSNLAETSLLGVKPEDIEGRERENPITTGLGQAVGLGAGFVTGLGPEAMLMSKAGQLAGGLTAAGKLTGAALEAAPLASRIGSEAVKQAAEMAILAADDELAKKIWTNPNETAEQAIANIGMSAALGGAGGAFVTGAISPLWKATVGPGVESFLSSMTNKLGGRASESAVPNVAKQLGEAAGVDLSKTPAISAKINGDPLAERLYSKLNQTDTTYYGKKVQNELAEVRNEVGSKISETLGHDPQYVNNLESKVDKYTRGSDIADTLHKEIEGVSGPINKAYDSANEHFKASPISLDSQRVMSEQISQKAIDNGWLKAADDSQKSLMEKVLKKLPEQESAEDLKKFITNLRDNNPYGTSTYQAAKDISGVLKSAQEQAVMEGIAMKGGSPEMAQAALNQYKDLKGQYARLMDTVDGLNEHLRVGKYYGPQSFLNNLKELGTTNAEGVLSRLSGTKADQLKVLEQFPATLSKVRQFHVDNLLTEARNAEGVIDPRKFTSQFDKLSPQIKELVADQTQQLRLKALGDLMTKTNDATHNFSNTARTIDKLTSGLASPLSVMASVMGYGAEGLMAHFGGIGIKEGEDALRYGMLKFLSSDAPVNAAGFKSMVQMIDNTIKGDAALNKAVGSVFKSGSTSAITMPTASSIAKLDRIVEKQSEDPQHLQEKFVNNQVGHYMDQHQLAIMSSSASAIAYLHSIKPQETTLGALDTPIPPTPAQQARYNRALTIAENPNVILDHVKNGTLQASDIKDLTSIYPSLYPVMQERLMSQVVNRHHDEEPIPYKTRLSLSLFMGQPLDASMQPLNIVAAQPKPVPPPEQPQGGGKGKGSTAKLGKSGPSYMTKDQAAESDRGNRD